MRTLVSPRASINQCNLIPNSRHCVAHDDVETCASDHCIQHKPFGQRETFNSGRLLEWSDMKPRATVQNLISTGVPLASAGRSGCERRPRHRGVFRKRGVHEGVRSACVFRIWCVRHTHVSPSATVAVAKRRASGGKLGRAIRRVVRSSRFATEKAGRRTAETAPPQICRFARARRRCV
jgi:hypothetical protein